MFLRTIDRQRPSTPWDERVATLPGPIGLDPPRARGHITYTYSQREP